MNPNEPTPNNDLNNANDLNNTQAPTVADLSQETAVNPEPAVVNNPVEAPKPPAVQPSADGDIVAPIGNELFHEPSLVKPKDNKVIIIIAVVAGVVVIAAGILIFWLLTKKD